MKSVLVVNMGSLLSLGISLKKKKDDIKAAENQKLRCLGQNSF